MNEKDETIKELETTVVLLEPANDNKEWYSQIQKVYTKLTIQVK